MTQADYRILLTVVYFSLFVAIIAWTIYKRKSKQFKDAAKLPLKDD
jgi:cbb3-type cytochrome oxidase subunit 3